MSDLVSCRSYFDLCNGWDVLTVSEIPVACGIWLGYDTTLCDVMDWPLNVLPTVTHLSLGGEVDQGTKFTALSPRCALS